jgi:hypothetical protein
MVQFVQGSLKDYLKLPRPESPVNLARVGQATHVFPLVTGLDRVFYAGSHEAVAMPVADCPPELLMIAEPLVWKFDGLGGKPFWVGRPGLERLIRELFRRGGIEVVLRGERPGLLREPDVTRLRSVGLPDTGLLEFVRRHERGAEITQLLQPSGLTLKAGAEVVDLSTGDEVQLMGFRLRQEGDQVRYRIASAAWDNLRHHLGTAHTEPDPPAAARQSVLGWVDALGPAFESGDVAEILSIAAAYDFREIIPADVLARWGDSQKRRWEECVRRAEHRNGTMNR